MSDDDPVAAAGDELYGAPVEEFMSRRTALAKQAKADGNAAAGKAIANLRKPTVAAAVVNRWVLADREVVDRLTALGDDLRRAQHDLDAATMRELSGRRRATVAEIVTSALAHSGQDDASTQLRDEVSSTFDAAVADPDVAARLGRLTRSESFSGFGLTGSPDLTLVQGGKGAPTPTNSRSTPKDTMPPATRRRLTRARDRARADLDAADERLATAERTESSTKARIEEITAEIADLQDELDEAKRTVDDARRAAKAERTKRRAAQSALDRAERQLEP